MGGCNLQMRIAYLEYINRVDDCHQIIANKRKICVYLYITGLPVLCCRNMTECLQQEVLHKRKTLTPLVRSLDKAVVRRYSPPQRFCVASNIGFATSISPVGANPGHSYTE